LALGLKKETADCYLFEYEEGKYKVIAESWLDLIADEKYYSQYKDVCIPAWSLHRLLELQLNSTDTRFEIRFNQLDLKDAYDFSVGHIEWLIKEGYFNKEYLV
jgi:hypothetical protein